MSKKEKSWLVPRKRRRGHRAPTSRFGHVVRPSKHHDGAIVLCLLDDGIRRRAGSFGFRGDHFWWQDQGEM